MCVGVGYRGGAGGGGGLMLGARWATHFPQQMEQNGFTSDSLHAVQPCKSSMI